MFEKRKKRKKKLASLDAQFKQCSNELSRLSPSSEKYQEVLAIQERVLDQRNMVEPPFWDEVGKELVSAAGMFGFASLWDRGNAVVGAKGELLKNGLRKLRK